MLLFTPFEILRVILTCGKQKLLDPLAMNGSYDPGFTLELHNKDLTIGEKICEKHIINLTMFQESTRLYREGSAKFGDQHGSSHPAKMWNICDISYMFKSDCLTCNSGNKVCK
jgi:hypothetical protein